MAKQSVFIKSREDTVTVSAKVPRSLKLRADKLRDQIQEIATNYRLIFLF